jgi:tetratricopeptide (TPR) repeat protein
MKRTLNWRLVAGLLVAFVLLGAGILALHTVMARPLFGLMLAEADRAESRGDHVRALALLDQCLSARPDDIDALARLGLILDSLARTEKARLRAFMVLDQVARRAPRREDIRRRLVRIALDLGRRSPGRLNDAKEHMDILRKAHPQDAELAEQMGRYHEARGQAAEAAVWYGKAIAGDPARVGAYSRLADLLRGKLDQPRQADQVMDRLVTGNPKSAPAYLARGNYRKTWDLPGSVPDVTRARQLAPDDVDVLLASATLARQNGDVAGAREDLRRGLKGNPRNPALYAALAGLEVQSGHQSAAGTILRQGIRALPDDEGLRLGLVEIQIQAGDLERAKTGLDRLRGRRTAPERVDFLEARLLMGRGEWHRAADRLERLRPRLLASAALLQEADLALAQCYEKLGDVDHQYSAYRRAFDRDPTSEAALRGLVAVLLARDDRDSAVREYRETFAGGPKSTAARLGLARLLIARGRQTPRDPGAFREAEAVLDEVAAAQPGSLDVAILRAEILAARGQPGEAARLLGKAREAHPDLLAAWLAEAAGQTPRDALATLDKARRRFGDRGDLLALSAERWASLGGGDARPALDRLASDATRLPGADRGRALRAVSEALRRLGDDAAADRLSDRLAAELPDDTEVQHLAFEAALRRDDLQAMRRAVENLRRVEGPEGTFWRLNEARTLIAAARRTPGSPLSNIRVLLSALASRRPNWPPVALVQGELEEAAGDRDAAILAYRRALESGARDAAVVWRLSALLFQSGRYEEADQTLRRLPKDPAPPPPLYQFAAEVALRSDDAGRAVGLARDAVPERSADYRDHLWLGHVLDAAGRSDEAERALRRAVALKEDVPATWVALVRHLVSAGRADEAEAEARKAGLRVTGEHAPLMLARCQEALGHTDLAAAAYRKAVAAKPDDPETLRSAATFYLNSDQPSAAVPCLRKLAALDAKSPEDARWASAAIANLLVERGQIAELPQAAPAPAPARSDDSSEPAIDRAASARRAEAVELATRGGRSGRRRAVELLRTLVDQPNPAPGDRFLLARLLEVDGDWPAARQVMRDLLETHGDEPTYLAYFARGLVQHGEAGQAGVWVERLERLQPRAFRTLAVSALMLKAQGKASDASERLTAYARENPGEARRVAGLLEELGAVGAAEQIYRREIARPDRPRGRLELALFLGRQGRIDEALDLCEAARKRCSPEDIAAACVAVLTASATNSDGRQARRVDGWFAGWLRDRPNSPRLTFCLATLRCVQGRYQEAESLYRGIVGRDEATGLVLNNLAYLLALAGGRADEAAEFIDRAVALGGESPLLLDTRAVVALRRGKSRRAIDDLENAITSAPTALRYFHLAQAYLAENDERSARAAWKEARTRGLKPDGIFPFERQDYERLAAALSEKVGQAATTSGTRGPARSARVLPK